MFMTAAYIQTAQSNCAQVPKHFDMSHKVHLSVWESWVFAGDSGESWTDEDIPSYMNPQTVSHMKER